MKKINLILITLIILIAGILRLSNLSQNPPSPYWDEVSLGYDAYSILKTGKDFHGDSFPIVAFESFGDFKPSLYFYATVPSIFFFGLNTFAIRFPSAFFGILTVFLTYYLTKKLTKSDSISLLASFLLSVSPWHLQLSRVGFEANLGLFLVVLATWLFIKSLSKPKWLFFSVTSFALSMYTYHANRVFVPLLGLSLGIFYFKKIIKHKKMVILSTILFLSLITPLTIKLSDPEVTKRFQETSAFSSLDPIVESNSLIQEDEGKLFSRLAHHRYWQYLTIFSTHYLDHFTDTFLFLSGDINPRHSTQAVGSFFMIQMPLIIWGIIVSMKNKRLFPLLLLLLLAPVPAALTKATPHALRSLPLVIPLTIFSAIGTLKLKKPLIIVVSIILILEFSRYLFIYHHTYPQKQSLHWQYGYQQMIQYVNHNQDKYQKIFITRELGRPSIYYWFYSKTDPREIQILNDQVRKDQGEFLEFQNITFGSLPSLLPEKSLVVIGPTESIINKSHLLKEIYDLNDNLVFRIYET